MFCVRSALREKNLDASVREAFKIMQLSQRRVRGSEAEKENLILKFVSLRIWSGCSSLFRSVPRHRCVVVGLLCASRRVSRENVAVISLCL